MLALDHARVDYLRRVWSFVRGVLSEWLLVLQWQLTLRDIGVSMTGSGMTIMATPLPE